MRADHGVGLHLCLASLRLSLYDSLRAETFRLYISIAIFLTLFDTCDALCFMRATMECRFWGMLVVHLHNFESLLVFVGVRRHLTRRIHAHLELSRHSKGPYLSISSRVVFITLLLVTRGKFKSAAAS